MPVRVLHAAGNVRQLLPLVSHPAVDAIEADVWVRAGRVVAHHDRPLGPLPFHLGSHGFRRRHSTPVRIEELIDAVGGHAALVLDVRSWIGDPAPDVARALALAPDRSRISLSCESWELADRLRVRLPQVRVMYSVRSEHQLRRFIAGRMSGELPRVDVTVRHTLLRTPEQLESLACRAASVGVWTVDDPARARELAAWGAGMVTSNRIEVLQAI